MIKYEIEQLVEKVGSPYFLVIAAAKRARQISDYMNSVKKHEMVHVVPPQVELEEMIEANPLSIAMREILEDKIEYSRPDYTEIV